MDLDRCTRHLALEPRTLSGENGGGDASLIVSAITLELAAQRAEAAIFQDQTPRPFSSLVSRAVFSPGTDILSQELASFAATAAAAAAASAELLDGAVGNNSLTESGPGRGRPGWPMQKAP